MTLVVPVHFSAKTLTFLLKVRPIKNPQQVLEDKLFDILI